MRLRVDQLPAAAAIHDDRRVTGDHLFVHQEVGAEWALILDHRLILDCLEREPEPRTVQAIAALEPVEAVFRLSLGSP